MNAHVLQHPMRRPGSVDAILNGEVVALELDALNSRTIVVAIVAMPSDENSVDGIAVRYRSAAMRIRSRPTGGGCLFDADKSVNAIVKIRSTLAVVPWTLVVLPSTILGHIFWQLELDSFVIAQ